MAPGSVDDTLAQIQYYYSDSRYLPGYGADWPVVERPLRGSLTLVLRPISSLRYGKVTGVRVLTTIPLASP